MNIANAALLAIRQELIDGTPETLSFAAELREFDFLAKDAATVTFELFGERLAECRAGAGSGLDSIALSCRRGFHEMVSPAVGNYVVGLLARAVLFATVQDNEETGAHDAR